PCPPAGQRLSEAYWISPQASRLADEGLTALGAVPIRPQQFQHALDLPFEAVHALRDDVVPSLLARGMFDRERERPADLETRAVHGGQIIDALFSRRRRELRSRDELAAEPLLEQFAVLDQHDIAALGDAVESRVQEEKADHDIVEYHQHRRAEEPADQRVVVADDRV